MLKSLSKLENCYQKFDEASNKTRKELLKILRTQLPRDLNSTRASQLIRLYDILLFMSAYPHDEKEVKQVNLLFSKISSRLKNTSGSHPAVLEASGLPFTHMLSTFTHETLVWLSTQHEVKLTLGGYDEKGNVLNTALRQSLSSLEKSETEKEYVNADLLYHLGVDERHTLSFLLHEFQKLRQVPHLKDKLWSDLDLYVQVSGKSASYSRHGNRLNAKPFYHSDLLRSFDHQQLIRTPLPAPVDLQHEAALHLLDVIRRSMSLSMRETDPGTYAEIKSLRFYELERGISVALYGMQESRQLPLESYIGYTLFKNGYPAAYGGSWVFGRTAEFGLNIFDAFRGGESGYILCQLLRVYKMVFGLHEVAIDAYQFGRDNEDGIRSGAYWFYYRYGFRSLDKQLIKLADLEWHKIKSDKKYRTSQKILRSFTRANMSVRFEAHEQGDTRTYLNKIATVLRKKGKISRLQAEAECLRMLKKYFPDRADELLQKEAWFEIMALLLYAGKKTQQRELMEKLILAKESNPYAYNDLLIATFEK